MKRWARLAVVCAALLPCACIIRDTTHTLLLQPGGGLTWVVLERNARSSSGDLAERGDEERAYLAAAMRGDNDAARALRLLGGESVKVSVLRDSRPFALWTEASFPSAADAAERFLAAQGVPGCARYWRDGLEEHLELSLEVPPEETGDDGGDGLDLPMPDDVDQLEILLTEGRFIAAQGFTVDGDRAALDPVGDEELAPGDTLLLSLTWTTAPEEQTPDAAVDAP
jgi:hypothetical protein